MARNIATQLALGRVVVLHVDADVPWVDTDPAPHQKSKHLDKLRRALDHARGTRGVAPDDLVIMAPHAAIEAWTFRKTPTAPYGSFEKPTLTLWSARTLCGPPIRRCSIRCRRPASASSRRSDLPGTWSFFGRGRPLMPSRRAVRSPASCETSAPVRRSPPARQVRTRSERPRRCSAPRGRSGSRRLRRLLILHRALLRPGYH